MIPKPTYLIVISAPSGAGKTTLCQMLLNEFPTVKLSISSTSRKPRGSEVHGKEYFFLTQEEFERQIQANRFAEWAQVHGNFYGTSKDVIEKAFHSHESVLLDIDVQGAAQLKSAYPKECFRIFISPPSLEELEKRLRTRGTETEEAIQKRLRNAKAEMEEGQKFDAIIINDTLDRAYLELRTLLETQLKIPTRKGKNG